MWDQLPELILMQIFSHLDCQDRVNVDRTCQAWSHGLAMPMLWRSITIIIDRDLRDDLPSTKELMAKYGQHMKNLKLTWSRPYMLPREIRDTSNIKAKEGINFLAIIKSKDVQLTTLILTDWFFGTNWNHRSKLLYALAHFLRYQRKLELLSLINANLSINDVLRLFRAVSWSCGNTLKYLDIRGAFKDWQAPHSNSRYLRYLSRLHTLTTFQLDYPALSDHALNCLASTETKLLKNLHISIRDSDSRQHTIGDAAWHNLVTVCPQLAVSYTIAEVMLQLRNNRELLDDLLILMLQRCKHLAKLQYDGIIRSLDILREIFQLQMDCKTNFETIHVKPRNVNTQNRAILDEIGYQYNHKLLNQGIDFRMEDPVSALHFY
ncbi:hypothetical protein PV325_008378 [Microctonus aethiopoides]|nr:hypothetical protein PV325_008378 [Microctonus aethiopoides]